MKPDPLRILTLAGLVLALGLPAGCENAKWGGTDPKQSPRPSRQRQAATKADNDIYRVLCFYPINMWKSFDAAGDPNPEGFTFVLYLLSHATNKGVYADGTFHVRIFLVERDAEGQTARGLVFESRADLSELPKREATRFGVGYQPQVYWGDLDVYNRDIEIVVQYESPGGRVLQSQTKRVKVPARRAG